jgi:hypothetical protein
MARAIPLLLIGLFLGGVIGFTIAAANGITFDGHDHGPPMQRGAQESHDHGAMLSVSGGVSAPTLSLQATRDPASGWNLHIMTGLLPSPRKVPAESMFLVKAMSM